MTGTGLIVLLVSVVTGLAVNEMSDVSPWLANWLVRKAAYLREGDTPRAHIRAKDHLALIHDRPGKLLKLCTALGFIAEASTVRTRKALADHFGLTASTSETNDKPSSLIAPYLFPTEKYRGEWARHWIHPAKNISLGVPAAAGAVYAAGRYLHGSVFGLTLAGIILAFVAVGGWRLLAWRLDRFVITDKRLVLTTGVIRRRVSMVPLLRVTDMRYVQSPLGRLLDYGEFELVSAGAARTMRSIKNLPKPSELYLRAVEEMYEPEAVEARLEVQNGDTADVGTSRKAGRSIAAHIDALPEEQVTALAALFGITLRRSIAAHLDGLPEEQLTALAALFGFADYRDDRAETDDDDNPDGDSRDA
jgi:membrane protein YdbS with pleckstrin-like domain